MNGRRVMAIMLRQIYLMRGSFSRVSPLFLWVAIDIILWGFISKYLNSVSEAKFNFVPVLLGAVLLWDFFTRVMQGITMAFFEDVWSRNFLNIFSTPLTISEYVTGLILCSMVAGMIGIAVMLVLSTAIFGLSFLSYGVALVPILSTLFLFGVALGILACAFVLQYGPSAEWFVWPIPAVLSPFCCVYYPLATLPKGMQWLAWGLPPSYVFEALRAVAAGHSVSWPVVFIGMILAAIYAYLAGLFFQRTYQNAVRSGLIARYSAESVA